MGLVFPRLGLEWKVLPYLGFKAAVVQDDYAFSDPADKNRFYADFYPYSIWNGEEATDSMRDILKRYVGEFPDGKQVPKGIYDDSHGKGAMFQKVFKMDPHDSYKTIVAKAGPKGDFTVEQCEAGDFATAELWRGGASQGFTPIMAQSFKVWEARQIVAPAETVLQPLTAAEARRTGAEAKTTMVLASDYATATPNTWEQEQALLGAAMDLAKSYPAPAQRYVFFSLSCSSESWSPGQVQQKSLHKTVWSDEIGADSSVNYVQTSTCLPPRYVNHIVKPKLLDLMWQDATQTWREQSAGMDVSQATEKKNSVKRVLEDHAASGTAAAPSAAACDERTAFLVPSKRAKNEGGSKK